MSDNIFTIQTVKITTLNSNGNFRPSTYILIQVEFYFISNVFQLEKNAASNQDLNCCSLTDLLPIVET